MKRLQIRLPNSIHDRVSKLADQDGVEGVDHDYQSIAQGEVGVNAQGVGSTSKLMVSGNRKLIGGIFC